ncbi:MAG: GNAT family N-acetyltransferase [Gammaproteobacteria bacterium]|nr:GNAT family N-acetyltransferase [Gammaproteobacteria bacterium]MBU1732225.1 GNAT family N-acetyltransferase [Gammaproteobacteria bacterium]MBU1893245.1 GNAT family N-acetyltransferase [Gammaproteobacteria bacterium]
MARLPELETPRLCIIPFNEQLLTERYVDWLNDPEVVRYSEQRHRHHDLAGCTAYFRSFENSPHYFCAILHKGTPEEHIGNISIAMDCANRVADISIMIGEKQYWGQSLGAEAWKCVMEELFVHQNIRKITAGTMAINHGMLAVMKRCGMEEEGRRKRQFLCDEQEVDMVMAAAFVHSLK